MLPSHRRRGRLSVAVVLAALMGSSMVASAHHDPVNPDDPHTYKNPHAGFVAPERAPGRLAPASGALLGVHPEDAHGADITPENQGIIETEESQGRRMDIDNSYYQFSEIADEYDPAKVAVPYNFNDPSTWDGRGLSRLAYWDVHMGRIPLISWACMNSSNINRGDYDDVIRTTGLGFQALGADFFMRYCWEMDGSKRIKDADDVDNDGNRSESHVGEPEEFIKAWNRVYDIIAAPDVPMTHDVPLKVERVGAKNVVWVWCGNAAHFKDTNDAMHYAWDYYPGDATVDWISADGYNWALARRNKNAGYSQDDWRGFVEIYDDFMVWSRWTPAAGPVPESMRFDLNDDGHPDPTKPTGVPEAFPRKGAVRPIMIGEYGVIEPTGGGEPPSKYANIGPHLTKPNWLTEAHDTVNGDKKSQWSMDGCHWCGIFSDIAAMVYFDINADGSDQNGDWRINSSPASIQAFKSSASQDPWFKQIHNIGWPQSANSNYQSTPPKPGGPTPTTQPSTTPTTTQPGQVAKAGYWMLGAGGAVYPFGEAGTHGDVTAHLPTPAQVAAVDVESSPSGKGYWVVDTAGRVFGMGDAAHYGNAPVVALVAGEKVTSLSSTPTGKGYWLFTTKGRAIAFGDAAHHGDTSTKALNAPVLDSIPTPTGNGYYMVAADGGIFTFGDAKFYGSTGNIKLNQPVQSLVPDPDGKGYWLVAADGGVFTFETVFKGSMGDIRLNKPMTGMIPYGTGYLMVAEDGGIFNFSDKPFSGSLGNTKIPHPIVAVAAIK